MRAAAALLPPTSDGVDPSLFDNRVVKDMERLLRRVLGLPGQPAVVLMQASGVVVVK
jgi:hypothetical protein